MKSEDEIARAHDALVGIIAGEVPLKLEGREDEIALRAAVDALCWVLEYAHSKTFAENLLEIEAAAFAKGFQLGPRHD